MHRPSTAVSASLFAAGCSLLLAIVVLVSVSRMETSFSAMRAQQSAPEMTHQLLTVRVPGRDLITIEIGAGMTTPVLVDVVEAAKQGLPPFKTCWTSGDTEYELCTAAGLGEEAHNERVAELQETYPDEGPCE